MVQRVLMSKDTFLWASGLRSVLLHTENVARGKLSFKNVGGGGGGGAKVHTMY